jgi:4-amino-4-deoxy-L-arabinose transferase-like glycosyltransferase
MNTLKNLAFLALAALACVVYMGKSYETSLHALDSTTHAMLALETTSQGWKPILPMPNFSTNKRPDLTFNDHPFTLFYLSGQFMRAFGPEAWTARFIPTLFSVGCVVALAVLGALLYSPAAGLVAGSILLLSRDFILIGSRFHLDTPMIFFIIVSFIFWIRRNWLGMGIAAGMGMWMKTPVALLVFPAALLELVLTRQVTRELFFKLVGTGFLALATASVIWIATGVMGGFELVRDYWVRQVWGTAVGGRGNPQAPDYLLGIKLLKRTYLPWLGLLVASVAVGLYKKRYRTREFALAFSAALIVEVFISSIKFKYYWYFLPVFPFLALLCVDPLRDWLRRQEKKVYVSFIALGTLLPAFLLAVPVSFGPENFPGIRKFSPIIQHYGNCSDSVLFIDGGQPFGGELDAIYELSFYTQRKILHGTCAEAQSLLDMHRPAWVVSMTSNIENCLSAASRKDYPVHYRYARQSMLTQKVPVAESTNLTPLTNELKPPRDCKPQPLPMDPYH